MWQLFLIPIEDSLGLGGHCVSPLNPLSDYFFLNNLRRRNTLSLTKFPPLRGFKGGTPFPPSYAKRREDKRSASIRDD
jgi:hypothetical protein